ALTAEFTVGEGKLMTHDEPCSMAPDDKHDLISGTCSHLPLSYLFHVAMAMGLRTLLDEAQDTEVEAPHSGNTNFFVNLCA
ncbi:hypothetical protein ACB295_21945, partial [Aeromonas caviae]